MKKVSLALSALALTFSAASAQAACDKGERQKCQKRCDTMRTAHVFLSPSVRLESANGFFSDDTELVCKVRARDPAFVGAAPRHTARPFL